jgi:general secretion pathway protein D
MIALLVHPSTFSSYGKVHPDCDMRSYCIVLLLAAVPLFAGDQPGAPELNTYLPTATGAPASHSQVAGATSLENNNDSPRPPESSACEKEMGANDSPCSQPGEQSLALREFHKALKRQSSFDLREALGHLELAAKLAPDNLNYRVALETARQNLANDDIRRGNRAAVNGQRVEALGSYQDALEFDPQNEFARQQLLGSLPLARASADTGNRETLLEAVQLNPNPLQQTFHIGGNSREVITQVCMAYGIVASFDESVPARHVQLDVDRVTWPVAMSAVTRLTRTFWTPFSAHQALFAADTAANRNNLERSYLRTFYLSDSITPQTLKEISGALRALFELRSVTVDLDANSISVRADGETMDAVARLLQGLKDGQPEVMLNVDVFQVSGSFTRSLGVTVPTQFQVFYIPTASAAALIVQTLAQQGSATLSNFNIGTNNLGLALPSASVQATQSQSNIRTLDQVTLRALQGEPAILKVGQRYPILTSAYSSVTNTATFTPPAPTFSYVDIGFNLKATPAIHRDGSIGVQLELQLNALGTQAASGLPEILNSEFSGFVSAKDGEPIVAAGNLMRSTSRTRSGWPGLAVIPGLGNVFSNTSKQLNDDELLIVITPHIIASNAISGNPPAFAFRTAR